MSSMSIDSGSVTPHVDGSFSRPIAGLPPPIVVPLRIVLPSAVPSSFAQPNNLGTSHVIETPPHESVLDEGHLSSASTVVSCTPPAASECTQSETSAVYSNCRDLGEVKGREPRPKWNFKDVPCPIYLNSFCTTHVFLLEITSAVLLRIACFLFLLELPFLQGSTSSGHVVYWPPHQAIGLAFFFFCLLYFAFSAISFFYLKRLCYLVPYYVAAATFLFGSLALAACVDVCSPFPLFFSHTSPISRGVTFFLGGAASSLLGVFNAACSVIVGQTRAFQRHDQLLHDELDSFGMTENWRARRSSDRNRKRAWEQWQRHKRRLEPTGQYRMHLQASPTKASSKAMPKYKLSYCFSLGNWLDYSETFVGSMCFCLAASVLLIPLAIWANSDPSNALTVVIISCGVLSVAVEALGIVHLVKYNRRLSCLANGKTRMQNMPSLGGASHLEEAIKSSDLKPAQNLFRQRAFLCMFLWNGICCWSMWHWLSYQSLIIASNSASEDRAHISTAYFPFILTIAAVLFIPLWIVFQRIFNLQQRTMASITGAFLSVAIALSTVILEHYLTTTGVNICGALLGTALGGLLFSNRTLVIQALDAGHCQTGRRTDAFALCILSTVHIPIAGVTVFSMYIASNYVENPTPRPNAFLMFGLLPAILLALSSAWFASRFPLKNALHMDCLKSLAQRYNGHPSTDPIDGSPKSPIDVNGIIQDIRKRHLYYMPPGQRCGSSPTFSSTSSVSHFDACHVDVAPVDSLRCPTSCPQCETGSSAEASEFCLLSTIANIEKELRSLTAFPVDQSPHLVFAPVINTTPHTILCPSSLPPDVPASGYVPTLSRHRLIDVHPALIFDAGAIVVDLTDPSLTSLKRPHGVPSKETSVKQTHLEDFNGPRVLKPDRPLSIFPHSMNHNSNQSWSIDSPSVCTPPNVTVSDNKSGSVRRPEWPSSRLHVFRPSTSFTFADEQLSYRRAGYHVSRMKLGGNKMAGMCFQSRLLLESENGVRPNPDDSKRLPTLIESEEDPVVVHRRLSEMLHIHRRISVDNMPSRRPSGLRRVIASWKAKRQDEKQDKNVHYDQFNDNQFSAQNDDHVDHMTTARFDRHHYYPPTMTDQEFCVHFSPSLPSNDLSRYVPSDDDVRRSSSAHSARAFEIGEAGSFMFPERLIFPSTNDRYRFIN